jgi:hypothetical protein
MTCSHCAGVEAIWMHVADPPSMEELALVFHVPIETVRGAQGLMDHEMDYLHDDTPLPPAICDLVLGHLCEVWDATTHLPSHAPRGRLHAKPLAEIMAHNIGEQISHANHWGHFIEHYERVTHPFGGLPCGYRYRLKLKRQHR